MFRYRKGKIKPLHYYNAKTNNKAKLKCIYNHWNIMHFVNREYLYLCNEANATLHLLIIPVITGREAIMSNNQTRFIELLKENGLKVTTQRIAILEVLDSRPDEHLTAEEIYDCVKEKYPEIGLATVYRTIQLLSELHLIDKLNLDDGYVRYEIGKLGKEKFKHRHHHLICHNCGNVFSFEDDLLEALEQRIYESKGFRVVDHEVKLFGYCTKCQCEKEDSSERA